MAKKYYTVLSRLPDQPWEPQFGDYVRSCAEAEMADMKPYGRFPKGTKFMIICTGDQQRDINLGVQVENAKLKLGVSQ